MANMFGVDLGSMNLKIYNRSTKSVEKTKNVVSILNHRGICALGDEAYEMYEKAPEQIEVCFPVEQGVIADYKSMQILITSFLSRIAKGRLRGSDFLIAIPTNITEVEKKAFFDLLFRNKIKPKNVLLVDKPVAEVAGLGLDAVSANGVFLADIGYQTTEISVVSLGGVVVSERLPFGSGRLDDAIISALRKNHNLLIGHRSAIQLKEKKGAAVCREEKQEQTTVVGMNLVTGLPASMQIDLQMIHQAIQEPLRIICDAIRRILERIPPELAKDIVNDGIRLTGGGSSLKGLDQMIADLAGIRVHTCENPEDCAAAGLGVIMNTPAFHRLAETMKTMVFK